MNSPRNRPLKPTQHAREQLLTSILSGEYPPGSALPAERVLAEQVGVTRPTLRENLQSLAREGWITISHGRATTVNDYWAQGGLSLLSTMAKYAEYLPAGFVTQLLELRVVMIPAFARIACRRNVAALTDYLSRAVQLPDDPRAFAEYDWGLQELMARVSENRIFPLMLNDFAYLFKTMAVFYFAEEKGRNSSRTYYANLLSAMQKSEEDVERVVRDVMEESIRIWREVSNT